MVKKHIKSTFDDWLDDVFITRAHTGIHDWEHSSPIEHSYIARLFAAPVASTKPYTDDQISKGLWELLGNGGSAFREITHQHITPTMRVQIIKDMYVVFEQLFAPRCSAKLCENQTKEQFNSLNPLNSVCFMWWDIIPLYGKSGQPEREVLDPYCIEVMERTLRLNSIACQEAALHGLGHWAYAYPEKVQPIIDAYLAREKNLPPDLREYALDARRGMVL